MKIKFGILMSVIFALLFVSRVSAQDNSFRIPEKARQISKNVYHLGKARDPKLGVIVDGYAIVHRGKSNEAKPDHAGGPKDKGPSATSSCYTFLANGAKWKTRESYMVKPDNIYGISNADIRSIVAGGIQKWEDAASYNILGDEITNTVDGADESSPDDKNEVLFGPIADSNTIAVTIVWGIFGGRPSGRQLVEWDQIYNTAYVWGTDESSDKMDFDNIATHELGHSVGLGDLYEASCDQETMYGYGTEGQTIKRSLNDGDIAGIQSLY